MNVRLSATTSGANEKSFSYQSKNRRGHLLAVSSRAYTLSSFLWVELLSAIRAACEEIFQGCRHGQWRNMLGRARNST